ncbi:TetR/AcrR family transcriptional regulator [Streptomyces alboflavus]|uniref:TetR/AcrR family transcriptional regulator n=1 Tax=Streptomyces alboflavus TaxID=67267 RepID=UPI003695344D
MAHIPAAERRPQLVQAAIDLMAREGIAAGSTRAIAAELGVAQATVHYTFGTKKELYAAVLERLTGDILERVRTAAPGEASFDGTVQAMARALGASLRERPGQYLLMTELYVLALRDPDLREMAAEQQRGLEDTAAALVTEVSRRSGTDPAVDARTMARFFLAGFDGLAMQHLTASAPGDSGGPLEADLELLVASCLELACKDPRG